jgi:acetyltransferase-like isoleucine patch superfamily enzyme
MIANIIRYLASMLPFSLSFRPVLYRISGMKIGRDVVMDRGIQVTKAENIEIGDRACIAAYVSILGEITAVNSRLEKDYGIYKSDRVKIGEDVYVGVKATILPGVTIGKMATIGANSLVTSDVPEYAVALGVPARIFLKRTPKDVD